MKSVPIDFPHASTLHLKETAVLAYKNSTNRPRHPQAAVRRAVEGWGASVFEADIPCVAPVESVSDSQDPYSCQHRRSTGSVGATRALGSPSTGSSNRSSADAPAGAAPVSADTPAETPDSAGLQEVLRCVTAAADVAPGGRVLLVLEAPQLLWLVQKGFAFANNGVQPVVVRSARAPARLAGPSSALGVLRATPGVLHLRRRKRERKTVQIEAVIPRLAPVRGESESSRCPPFPYLLLCSWASMTSATCSARTLRLG